MSNRKKICCVIGTRPEAIKMAPVICLLNESKTMEPYVLATGQHTDMLYQALSHFNVEPNRNLCVMKHSQSLDYLTSTVLVETGKVLDEVKPDAVMVHGDTTTALASAMSAFYRKIPIVHVEAGLRSGDIHLPFPEELNRVVVDRISDILFAPTQRARKNLLNEGVSDKKIVVTGNTVIDALKMTLQKLKEPLEEKLRALPEDVRLILVTAHRRESWGDPLLNICEAIDEIVTRHNDIWVIFPMHKNPNVRITVQNILGKKNRVILCDPLGYPDFIWAMQRSDLILTDSGGIQEEATALGKPTLVMRDVTERPEALEYGNAFLVGTSKIRIIEMSNQILSEISKKEYEETKKELFNATTPFGSGEASRTIVLVTEEYLNNKVSMTVNEK